MFLAKIVKQNRGKDNSWNVKGKISDIVCEYFNQFHIKSSTASGFHR